MLAQPMNAVAELVKEVDEGAAECLLSAFLRATSSSLKGSSNDVADRVGF
jgi:hypothetical protein